jgi:K+-sensing histidine kinase KdpD
MATRADPDRPKKARAAGGVSRRPLPDPPRRILLASPGTPFSEEVLERTIELATPEHAKITVLSIAKVFGTSLGIPHPGLRPTPGEWEEQRRIVNRAAKVLKRRGFEVRVQVTRTRNPSKMISRWAEHLHMHAVVIADPGLPKWRRFIEGDLGHDIERRCHIRVHVVPVSASSERSSGA